jgi:hypothetical protein
MYISDTMKRKKKLFSIAPRTDIILKEMRRGGFIMSRAVDNAVDIYYKDLKKRGLI